MHSKPRTPYQIFLRSPDLISQSLILTSTLIQPTTLAHLKSSLFPSIPSSSYFTFNGKPLDDSIPLIPSLFPPFSTLILTCRLLGGGGDGGATGAESRDCYLNMYAEKKPDKVDPNEQRLSKWLNCTLSGEPLMAPCVVDGLGNVFNKEALVRALLEKNLPKELGHIKGLKDMVGIELSRMKGDGDVRFQCPISGLEFNGKYIFYALKGCGHVLSAKALKEVKSSACLICHGEFKEDDKIAINGSEEEVKALRQRLEEERAKEKESKMKKAKKGKNGEEPVGLIAVKRVGGDANVENGSSGGKRFKAADVMPKNATKEVYASIFTSSKKKTGLRETFSCRSLPLGDKQGVLENMKLILRAVCLCWDRQTQDLNNDWILFRGRSLVPVSCEVVKDNIDGCYPSSHYPIFAEFMLPRMIRLLEPPAQEEE